MYVRDGVLVAVGVWIGATAMSCRRATREDAASPTAADGSEQSTVLVASHPAATPDRSSALELDPVENSSTEPTSEEVGLELATHNRYAYSGITQRKDYSWPGGKRLAVYFAINLEHFEFGKGMGAKLGGQCAIRATITAAAIEPTTASVCSPHPPLVTCYGRTCSFGEPDVLNYSWRDYGGCYDLTSYLSTTRSDDVYPV